MNQEQQRKKIVEEATKLFYDNGYNKTSCSQIASACGLSQGGLFYHFATKSDIGMAVYDSYMHQLKNIIARRVYDIYRKYDLQIGTALESLYEIKLLTDDAKARRFYIEYFKSNMTSLYCFPLISFYKLHSKRYKLTLDDETLKIIAIKSHSTCVVLTLAFLENVLDCDLRTFSDIIVRTPYEAMKIPDDVIERIIESAYRDYDVLNLNIKPYFCFE